MKKLLLFLLLVFLFSCEMLEICKTCTTTYSGAGISTPSSITLEVCGKELRQADGATTSMQIGSIIVTGRTTCR